MNTVLVMGGALSIARDSSIALCAYAPPRPAQYKIEKCIRIPYAFGTQHMALRVVDVKPSDEDEDATDRPTDMFRDSVVLFCHGNGDDLGTVRGYMQWLCKTLKCRIVSFDYPGYGHSSGTTSEDSIYASVLLAYNYCCESIRARRIILLGKSLGSGAAMFLASRRDIQQGRRICGTVLVSPMASGVRTLSAAKYMNRALLHGLDAQFMPNIKYAKKVSASVLVMHGLDDTVVPVENGYAIHAALPEAYRASPTWFPQCGHNDIETNQEAKFIAHLRRHVYDCLEKEKET